MFITFEVQEHIYRSTMRLKTISAQNDQGGGHEGIYWVGNYAHFIG